MLRSSFGFHRSMIVINLYQVKTESGEPVHSWQFVQIGDWNNHRLYFNPAESISDGDAKQGFNFFLLGFAQGPAIHDGKDDIWSAATEVTVDARGYGYWDGVRHIHITPENDGYFNYPNVLMWSEFYRTLRQLEINFCEDNEGDKY